MYPIEHLDEDDDNGTMPDNVKTLADAVVGHRIVSAQPGTAPVTKTIYGRTEIWELHGFILELDNGTRVLMEDDSDCCAYTSLTDFEIDDLVDWQLTESPAARLQCPRPVIATPGLQQPPTEDTDDAA